MKETKNKVKKETMFRHVMDSIDLIKSEYHYLDTELQEQNLKIKELHNYIYNKMINIDNGVSGNLIEKNILVDLVYKMLELELIEKFKGE